MPAAIPALLDLAAELASVMLLLALIFMLYAYRYTLGAVMLWVAAGFRAVHLGSVANWLESADNAIKHGLGVGIQAAEWSVNALWLGLRDLLHYLTSQIEGLALDVDHALARGVGGVGSKLKKWATAYIAKELKGFRHWVTGYVGGLVHGLGKLITGIHAQIRALDKRIAHVAQELEHWGGLTRKQLKALLRRLSALGWLAAFAGVGALVGAGLRKLHLGWLTSYKGVGALVGAGLAALGLKWLKCDNVGKFGRRLCGNDGRLLHSLLDDLLAAGVDVLLITHLCEFMRPITKYGAQALDTFLPVILQAEGFVCTGHEGAPSGTVAADWVASSGRPSGA